MDKSLRDASLQSAFPHPTSSQPISRKTLQILSELPTLESWPQLNSNERERRTRILERIEQHIIEEGPHQAFSDPERGRLFMPFAALKGYDDLIKETEKL